MFALLKIIYTKPTPLSVFSDRFPSSFLRVREVLAAGARFAEAEIRLPLGKERGAAMRMKATGNALLRLGIREFVLPEHGFEKLIGLSPVSPLPLYRAFAAEIAVKTCRELSVFPSGATAVIISDRCGRDVARAAYALCGYFRNVALCCRYGDGGLSDRLLSRFGIPALTRPPEGPAISLCFDRPAYPVEGPSIRFFEGEDDHMRYGARIKSPLEGCDGPSASCALWRIGALRDREIKSMILC